MVLSRIWKISIYFPVHIYNKKCVYFKEWSSSLSLCVLNLHLHILFHILTISGLNVLLWFLYHSKSVIYSVSQSWMQSLFTIWLITQEFSTFFTNIRNKKTFLCFMRTYFCLVSFLMILNIVFFLRFSTQFAFVLLTAKRRIFFHGISFLCRKKCYLSLALPLPIASLAEFGRSSILTPALIRGLKKIPFYAVKCLSKNVLQCNIAKKKGLTGEGLVLWRVF